jgi:hypothetical protein
MVPPPREGSTVVDKRKPRRPGPDPRVYRAVTGHPGGWAVPEEPLTGRQLIGLLMDRGVDLDRPIQVDVFPEHKGDDYLTSHTFLAFGAMIVPDDDSLAIGIGEDPRCE